MTPDASKQGKFGSLGAICLFIFLRVVCGGCGFKKNPDLNFLEPRGLPPKKKISLDRLEKTIPTRTKKPFSLGVCILGLKCFFSIEDSNPGPRFSAAKMVSD